MVCVRRALKPIQSQLPPSQVAPSHIQPGPGHFQASLCQGPPKPGTTTLVKPWNSSPGQVRTPFINYITPGAESNTSCHPSYKIKMLIFPLSRNQPHLSIYCHVYQQSNSKLALTGKHKNSKYRFKHHHHGREKASLRFHCTQNGSSSPSCGAQKNFYWDANMRVAILDTKLWTAAHASSAKLTPGWQSSNMKTSKYQVKSKQCWLRGEKSGISGKAKWFSLPQKEPSGTAGMGTHIMVLGFCSMQAFGPNVVTGHGPCRERVLLEAQKIISE